MWNRFKVLSGIVAGAVSRLHTSLNFGTDEVNLDLEEKHCLLCAHLVRRVSLDSITEVTATLARAKMQRGKDHPSVLAFRQQELENGRCACNGTRQIVDACSGRHDLPGLQRRGAFEKKKRRLVGPS